MPDTSPAARRTRDIMTSQERAGTAIARRIPDRVPIMDGPWSATVRRYGAY